MQCDCRSLHIIAVFATLQLHVSCFFLFFKKILLYYYLFTMEVVKIFVLTTSSFHSFAINCGLSHNTFALPRKPANCHPLPLSCWSISTQLLSAQHTAMDKVIEFYLKLSIKYADVLPLLNRHG